MRVLVKLLNGNRGASLVSVIVFSMFLSVVGYATLSMVLVENSISTDYLASTQAFWLAEAGLERAYRWLRYQDPAPGGIESFTQYDNVDLGTGTYTVLVDPDDGNANNYLKQYTLQSTGTVAGVSRTIEVTTGMTSFSDYAYLTGDEGYGVIWFTTDDLIEGRLHSNAQISITGSPTFMDLVTSSASSFNQGAGYDPDFQDGYQLGVPPVTFPTLQDLTDNYWANNDDPPPLVIDARFGRYASLEFNADGTLTYNLWHWAGPWWNRHKVYDVHDVVWNVADLEGFVYVNGDVQVWGTLDGEVTVMATDDIFIMDDLKYLDAGATGQPNSGCDDLLGLISVGDIIVADTAPNGTDCVIDAAMLTLGDSFTVENYSSGPFRGVLRVWGSISQSVRGPVGTFGGWWGNTGYQKDYHYDQRFYATPPPYYPETGQYSSYSWHEVTD